MNPETKVVIQLQKHGTGPNNKIIVNDVDITRFCRGVHINSGVNRIARVYLDLIPELVDVIVEEGEIRLIKPKSA